MSFIKVDLLNSKIFSTEKKSERFSWFSMPKNDFESTNFANFEEVVCNFGLTMTRFSEKMLIFNICRRGLMPNLIKKSWTVFNQRSTGGSPRDEYR